jgi:hypothetical protein
VTPFCSRPVKPGYQGTARPRPLTRGLLSSQGNRAFHGIWCNGYREVSLSRSSPPLTSSRLSSPPLASHPLPSPGPPTFFFLQLLKLIEKTQTQTALTIANCQLPTANCQLPTAKSSRRPALHCTAPQQVISSCLACRRSGLPKSFDQPGPRPRP